VKPRIAIFKLASCDGCQLSLLDLEDELLDLAAAVEIVHFPEATTRSEDGPYDIALVEGSVTTSEQLQRVLELRAEAKVLVTIGACATAGGIQALRNFADVDEYREIVYATPEYVETLTMSSPVADHVPVEHELRGCPIAKRQLLELLTALLAGRKPVLPTHSVCVECKLRGTACVMAARGIPCLGPVTQAGCGAICPAYGRGCYGCFGPAETANLDSITRWWAELGVDEDGITRALRTFNAEQFARAGADHAAD
jgi:coenzyme F420-reducing hydrogenase gamma subunit